MKATENGPAQSAPPLDQPDFTRTGPGTLAGKYLRRFWTPIAVLDDVKPGRAKPIRIMDEQFTYYRGESGRPHLIGFRCAHRGTQLSTGRVEGERLSCFYHGWTYDESGQCVAQPAEPDSYAHKIQIPGYATRDYLGLVFAFLGEGAPPPFPHLATFDRPGLIEAKSHMRTTSFFNQLENSVDQVHFNFVHRNSAFGGAGTNRELPAISGEETDYGILRHAIYSDGKDRISHILMPITMFSKVFDTDMGWTDHLAWRVPVDDNRHITFMVDLVEKTGVERDRYVEQRAARDRLMAELPPAAEILAAILRGEMHIDDVGDRPDLLGLQDDVALNAQQSMADRPPDRLGRSDVQVILLRKIWMRELHALATGKPLKNWAWPEGLNVVTGI
jgi:5,5'-dehydrodivanillate O-demethylase oxygenase subunit